MFWVSHHKLIGYKYRGASPLVRWFRLEMNVLHIPISRSIGYITFMLCCMVAACSPISYRAAVAEHAVVGLEDTQTSIEEKLSANIVTYEELIGLASKAGQAEIIVFPEFGLNPIDNQNRKQLSVVAEAIPEVGTVPCFSSAGEIVKRMSCAAKEQKISVLVNMVDRVTNGGSEYLYNTNVIFDENGVLVSKYYKNHEWYPLLRAYDQISSPDNATYTPTWGPTFGIFTCFDIMWPTPAVKTYIDEMGISHFLFPVQQGLWGDKTIIPHWSKQNSATLLSANLGSRVSGIFKDGKELPHETLYLREGCEENIKVAEVFI